MIRKGLQIRKGLPLTVERLREVLDYDPETGIFRWTDKTSPYTHRHRIGKPAGNTNPEGYLRITIDKTYYAGARLAWMYVYGVMPEGEIDHINRQRGDNRIANLRVVDRSANVHNSRRSRPSESGYTGVRFHAPIKKWKATIGAYKQRHHLGYFASAEEAHAAYLKAKKRLHIPARAIADHVAGRSAS